MTKALISHLFTVFILLSIGFSQLSYSAAQPSSSLLSFQEGVDFIELSSELTQADALSLSPIPELVLVFWYGSESSFQVLSALSRTPYSEQLSLWPAVFRERWRPAAKLALKASQLGLTTEQHLAIMQQVLGRRLNWNEPGTEQAILTPIINNANAEQMSTEQLELTLRDASIPKELKTIQNRINSYPISSVPTIIFKGQFVISAEQAKTSRRLIQILDFLNQRQYQLTNDSG